MTYTAAFSELDRSSIPAAGGKGANLGELTASGFPVPPGFVLTTEAYTAFVQAHGLQERIVELAQSVSAGDPSSSAEASARIKQLFTEAEIPEKLVDAILLAYGELCSAAGQTQGSPPEQLDLPVAVRSSATAEDLPDASFAGQQESYLNVQGQEALLGAVKHCWASLWTARAITYRLKQGIAPADVSLAVVVQQLVPAQAAGILFTANPLNGRRDQMVISASWGLGEAVVSGLMTPDTFTVDRSSHTITARQIADKQTMTVRVAGGTSEQPVPESQRAAPALGDEQALELARLGAQIEGQFGMPMDIEWAIVDNLVSILQARPITALPEPEVEPPGDWTLPIPKTICTRASIVELLPDPLTPLFGTLGARAIDAGTSQLFTDLFGPGLLKDPIFVTINSYAYLQIRMTLRLWGTALLKMRRVLPELFRGEARWREEARPRYLEVIERWQNRSLPELATAEMLDGVYQLTTGAVNIYNVYQSGVIALAIGAESLFSRFYEKLIRRREEPSALTMILGGDSMPMRAEKSLYDVAEWCRPHSDLASYISRTPGQGLAVQLGQAEAPPNVGAEAWRLWQSRIQAHLAEFGHAVYNLDFSQPVAADNPAPLLEALRLYINGQIPDPRQRQQQQIAVREAAAEAISGRLRGLRLKWFQKLHGWALKYVPMREEMLSDLGLGYPLLRRMLGELGGRLVRAGMVEGAGDIYWLQEAELIEAAAGLDAGSALMEMSETIRQRRAEWRAAKRVTPPETLPERSRYAAYMERFGPAAKAKVEGDTITGVGASPGSATVTACVLGGPQDFERMQPGAALVAAITTPAWTPLFAMAAAVVTDVGGPLSHGSIVAREYGIPAVLGTGTATRRIQNGHRITVDGDAGTVTLLDDPD